MMFYGKKNPGLILQSWVHLFSTSFEVLFQSNGFNFNQDP